MDVVGRALLILALGLAIFGSVAALAAARGAGPHGLLPAARRALYAVLAMSAGAFVLLEIAFAGPDFSYTVVVGHASLTTPLMYRLAAPWASQEGSLLLWLTLLSLTSTIAIRSLRGRMRDVEPYALSVLLLLAAFFAGLLVFAAKAVRHDAGGPARRGRAEPAAALPDDDDPPAAAYSGYTLFAVPFAFGIGALAAGRLGGDWIVHTRRYASRPGCCWASASSSARAGRTPSSAGAATGPGIPSRTPRCCPGSPRRPSSTRSWSRSGAAC